MWAPQPSPPTREGFQEPATVAGRPTAATGNQAERLQIRVRVPTKPSSSHPPLPIRTAYGRQFARRRPYLRPASDRVAA